MISPAVDPTVDVRHSAVTGACTLTATAAGPAGTLDVDLVPGVQVRVDRAEPRLLIDVWVGQDLRGRRPDGAAEVVRLLLGAGPAATLADPSATPVGPAHAPDQVLLSAVTAAAVSGQRPRLAGSVQALRLASAAAAQHPCPATEGLATRAAAAVAGALRTLERYDAAELRPALSGLLAEARALVERHLGEVHLGALGGVTDLVTSDLLRGDGPVAHQVGPVLVGAPADGSRLPVVVPVWAMHLPLATVWAGDRLLRVEVLPSDEPEAPYTVVADFPGPLPPVVWLRLSGPDGSPLLHVLGTGGTSMRFVVPQQTLVPWRRTHLSLVPDPSAPRLTAAAAEALAAREVAAMALRTSSETGRWSPDETRRWWLLCARHHARSGRSDRSDRLALAAIALHQSGAAAEDLEAETRRLAWGTPPDELRQALYLAGRWVSAAAAARSRTAVLEDPALVGLQPVVDAWVRDRLLHASDAATRGRSAADVLARMVEEVSAFADLDAGGVRIARASARAAVVQQALDLGEVALAHVVFARLLEDHDVLDDDPALRGQVAHLRDRLVALLG